jgi:hypothetical protein
MTELSIKEQIKDIKKATKIALRSKEASLKFLKDARIHLADRGTQKVIIRKK